MRAQATQFSAAEPGLGYIFQNRFALLRMLDLPEDAEVFIERNDDVEFVTVDGRITLGSLKHKAVGDRLSDLSVDFWKSVRIWVNHYKRDGRASSSARYILYSTASVSPGYLQSFVGEGGTAEARATGALEVLARSASKEVEKAKLDLGGLTTEEAQDFYSRISIAAGTPRIDAIPQMIDQRLRSTHPERRTALFERLEGWFTDRVINLLTGSSPGSIRVQEVTDKLVALNEQFRADNLPIDFRNKEPSDIDAANDSRMFVVQLHALEFQEKRVRHAIIDYYRAFEQRSLWARERLLFAGEIEEYEDRLVEEWDRFKAICCEDIDDGSDDDACLKAGRALYDWAVSNTEHLRIRRDVSEPYVVRGAFQMLANEDPPKVHWHPRFLNKLAKVFGAAA